MANLPHREPQPEFGELDALVDRYLDGVASDDEVRRLETLIVADEAAAERLSERSLTHRQISELLAEARLHDIMSRYAVGLNGLPRSMTAPSATEDAAQRSVERARGAGDQHIGSRRSLLVSLAAALAVAAAVAVVAWPQQEPTAPTEPADAIVEENDAAAATITQLADVEWSADAQRFRYGESLADGSRIAFDGGLAKVTFDCGAEVMLEGPCDFTVRDKMVGVLRRGKLAANVPRRAFAFAILSPKADFVDLGTSFGVTVDDEGDSELHVFEGEVLYSSPANGEQPESGSVHVRADEAVKFRQAGGSEGIAVDQSRFSPLLELRRATSGDEPPLAGVDLALWLKADAGVSMDEQGRVVGWQDILFDDNQTAEDATQFDELARPRLADRAINGRPAVRFDGASDFLLTTPLETTDDQTVLLVCQFGGSAFNKPRQWGGQIINYDGPPGREASNTFSPGILQIGEPLLETDFQPSLVSAQVFAGFIGSAVVETGRVDGKPLGAERPAVIAYRYDYGRGKADLSIDGHPFGESRAFAPQALTSRKIIGRHAWKELFFTGDLGELIIFNRALSDDELRAATEHLGRKYAIELDGASGASTAAVESSE